MNRYITGTILFLCITATSYSQRILTVEEAVATALQNNYDIRLLRNDSTLFELTNSYAYAAFLPRLNALRISSLQIRLCNPYMIPELSKIKQVLVA
ncbi:MAG: hypothetical protein EOO00_11130, partial [Chitinophagaceae bacterium]